MWQSREESFTREALTVGSVASGLGLYDWIQESLAAECHDRGGKSLLKSEAQARLESVLGSLHLFVLNS